MIGLGVLCLLCMMVWEVFTANPMIPPAIWRNGNIVLVRLTAKVVKRHV
jgi:hypothetical protein